MWWAMVQVGKALHDHDLQGLAPFGQGVLALDSEIVQVLQLRARHEIQGRATTKVENLEWPLSAQANLNGLLRAWSFKEASKT